MCYKYIVTFVTDNHCAFNETGDWSNGMIGVSKTFGGSSILSSPAYNKIYGPLVKRLRRRPLTAETGVRFPYELLKPGSRK